MRTLLIYLSLFFLSIASTHAQGMKKMAQKTEFESRLAKEAQTVESIESDFTQVKYLDVFDEKVTSKGKFYYQKSNKICMEYFRPMDYLIVINGSKLKIVSDGKKSIMNLSSNKMMAQMQDMLTACMIGDLSKMSSNYLLEYFEDARYYLVKIKPTNKAVQAYIAGIEIYLDKKDMSVHKLRLSETATRRSLRFVSLMVLLFLWIQIQTSCSPRMSGEGSTVLPAIELTQGESSQKYNIQLDFMKHHMSGMLIVRRMPDNEIRIVASTYFGLSLFDFSLRNDQFTVNSCIEPMKKEKVLKLLEMDFRRLFLSGKDIRVKTTKDSATEKRTSGKGFGKSVVYITGNTPGDPAQIKIKHPWIRLTIRLDKLSKEI